MSELSGMRSVAHADMTAFVSIRQSLAMAGKGGDVAVVMCGDSLTIYSRGVGSRAPFYHGIVDIWRGIASGKVNKLV